LEGLAGSKLRKRVQQIRSGKSGPALLMTSAYSFAESAIVISLLSCIVWFAPAGYDPNLFELLRGDAASEVQFVIAVAYTLAVAVIEPFYVASGFAMYLNRRVDLEAWDIEQEFRRADFARAAS